MAGTVGLNSSNDANRCIRNNPSKGLMEVSTKRISKHLSVTPQCHLHKGFFMLSCRTQIYQASSSACAFQGDPSWVFRKEHRMLSRGGAFTSNFERSLGHRIILSPNCLSQACKAKFQLQEILRCMTWILLPDIYLRTKDNRCFNEMYVKFSTEMLI